MQHTCPRCGTPIQAGQRFCAHCALPLDPASIAAYHAEVSVAPVSPPVPVRRSRGCAPLLWTGLGVFLVIALVGAWGSTLPPANPTPTPGHVLTALFTWTPRPPTRTALPAPPTAIPPTHVLTALFTWTPAPPKRTPVPGAPTPTTGPAPLTADELAYVAALNQQSQVTSAAFQTLSIETNAADQFTDAWKLRMVVPMVQIQNAARDAARLVAPPRFAAVDRNYQAGMQHYSRAMDLLAAGIDAQSPSILHQASTETTLGQAAIARATQELQAAIR